MPNENTENAAKNQPSEMQCSDCRAEKKAVALSPAVIDGKLKLVCGDCWTAAVEENRATIFSDEEMTAFSELRHAEALRPQNK